MNEIRLEVAKAFSRTPGSRYIREGDYSGELFRRDVLHPMIKQAIAERKVLNVDLDGTAGYGTSFLEEAFGGLVRQNFFTAEELRGVLRLTSTEEPYLVEDIESYINEADELRRQDQ
jgi:hypothetical protein